MNILIITQYFPPEMGAPQARLFELAKGLVAKNHSVTVLTAMPNYPTGRVYKNYRRRIRLVEEIAGIRVVRTAIYPSNSLRTAPRLVSYLSFALSSLIAGWPGIGKFDIALAESPPLFLAPAAWLISRIARAKTVLMVSDIWPDTAIRIGYATGGASVKAMLWLEGWAYRHYDVVALTNPGAMQQINDRFPNVRTTVISNGVDTTVFHPGLRSNDVRRQVGATANSFLVGYCGLHGLAQGLEVILEAADRMRNRTDVQFIMVGDGPVKADLIKIAEEKGLENIKFMGRRAKDEMPAILASCDALLVPLVARLPGTMPSKVYEALAVGTPPIVAAGCEGEVLVTQNGAGCSFEPMQGSQLAQVIRELADDPERVKEISHRAVDLAGRFDRDILVTRTELIFKSLVTGQALPDVSW